MIVHGPENISGIAGLLSSGQRKLGLDSWSICYKSNKYGFSADFEFGARGQKNGKGFLETLLEILPKADILHFYFGGSFTGRNLIDARIARSLGKKTFFTFMGCDIRNKNVRLESEDFEVCKGCSPQLCSENRELSLRVAMEGKEPIFVTSPDLIDEIESAVWLPLPIMVSNSSGYEDLDEERVFRVLHAPTDRTKKGTDIVINAIDALRLAGLNIELVLLEGKTQLEVHSIASTCQIAIDQITSGVYGTFGAEMMAKGIPTIAYISERYRPRYPEALPIIEANPNNIQIVLRSIYENRTGLKKVRLGSLDYARNYHCHEIVARRLMEFY